MLKKPSEMRFKQLVILEDVDPGSNEKIEFIHEGVKAVGRFLGPPCAKLRAGDSVVCIQLRDLWVPIFMEDKCP